MRGRRTWGGYLAVVLAIGCGPAAEVKLRTDSAAYQRLSERERAGTAKEDAELARAQKELQDALQELSMEKRNIEAADAEKRASEVAMSEARSRMTKALPDKQEDARHDLMAAEAGVDVQAARQAWLAACETWRQRLVVAAEHHVAAAEAAVELARAQILARHDDSIEVERYRGQYARLHKLWSEAQAQTKPARQEVDRLDAALTNAKGQYAKIKETVLPPPVVPAPAS